MNDEPTVPPERWITPHVTLGNIITLVTLLLALAAGYTQLIARVDVLTRDLSEHKASQIQEYQRRDVQETRNRFIDGRLDTIEEKLDRVLERVERKK